MALTYIKKEYRIRVLLAFISCMIVFTANMTAFAQDREVSEQDLYIDFGNILGSFVNDSGLVNYQGLKLERGDLDSFTQRLALLDSSEFDTWGESRRIAFWINAYNALTLKSIIENYPIKPTFPARLIHPHNSIRQIPGVWDKTAHIVMGKDLTLDEIEHDILRRQFNKPRIHMALVCASMGCAKLLNEPYTGLRLDDQLEDQTVAFLSHPDKFRIDKAGKVVFLSPYFKWFGQDFVYSYGTDKAFTGHNENERSALNFIYQYMNEKDRSFLKSSDYTIEYLDYDWSLNEQGGTGSKQ